MKNKDIKKLRLGGYNRRGYKEVRRKIKRRIEKELQVKLR